MSPRRYRPGRRETTMEDTRRRIVEATVALHARQGVLGTTYAMIAKQADVAIPTVYNHFPKLPALLAACTGHVAALAPPLGPEIFAGATDLEERLRVLVRALSAYYRFSRPWLRWAIHEAGLVPDLARLQEAAGAGHRRLIALALAPAFGPHPPEPLLALAEVLLDFPAWQRIGRDGKRSGDAAGEIVAQALVVLARAYIPAPRPAGSRGRARPPTRRQST